MNVEFSSGETYIRQVNMPEDIEFLPPNLTISVNYNFEGGIPIYFLSGYLIDED